MKKRVTALILCFNMILSLLVQFAPVALAEEAAATVVNPWDDPDAYLNRVAVFNVVGGADAVSDVHFFSDPREYDYNIHFPDDAYWLYEDSNSNDIEVDDMLLEITETYVGNHVHVLDAEQGIEEIVTALWLKVEAKEGYTLPEKMGDSKWIMYMNSVDIGLELPPALKFVRVEEQPEETPEDPEVIPPVQDGDDTDIQLPPSLEDVVGADYGIEELNKYALFTTDPVTLLKQPAAASKFVNIDANRLPAVVYLTHMITGDEQHGGSWYVFEKPSDISEIAGWDFVFVDANSVELPEDSVSDAMNELMGSATVDEYEDIVDRLISADRDFLEKIPEKFRELLSEHYNQMVIDETRTYNTIEAEYDGKSVPVSVTGLIPDNLTLLVNAVEDKYILDGEFDVESAEDIALALDIKMLDSENNQWQPKKGRQITVEIDVSQLGYPDGTIFQLEHEHGDEIYKYDIFIVMDGKLTVRTNGFSVYVATQNNVTNKNTNGIDANDAVAGNNGTITLTVGDGIKYYYVDPNPDYNNNPNTNNNFNTGTWQVDDPDGAIYYEIYQNGNASNGGVYAPWIKIVPLKETNNVSLSFVYGNVNNNWPPSIRDENSVTYSLKIIPPIADEDIDDGYKLYIKDTVNTNGCITAAVVDSQRKEVDLTGATFDWVRNDNIIIIPAAYSADKSGVNVARDHGGLLQTRLDQNGGNIENAAVQYTVTVTMPNGRKLSATYKVYYQSEILNASFEAPTAQEKNYTFFVNGHPGMFWKTTSPGAEEMITRDIEFVRYTNGNNNITNDVKFFPSRPYDDSQFAEINAEEVGALYQDIITAPGEKIEWDFYHSKRDENEHFEAMFVIFGATENAQKILGFDQIDDLLDDVTVEQKNTMHSNGSSMTITADDGAKYTIWYHDADKETYDSTHQWHQIKGVYQVPKENDNGTGQYRTRIFFVSDPRHPSAGGEAQESNYGNLIDAAKAGQYKNYLVEFYEETFVFKDGKTDVQYNYIGNTSTNPSRPLDIKGRALIYSSIDLSSSFDYFTNTERDLLSYVFINGANSPYNIRYYNKPYLFVENYEGKAEKPEGTNSPNNYDNYDIVMQVFFRDSAIAIEKRVVFPKIGNTTQEALTMMEKQALIDELYTADETDDKHGYDAEFHIDCNSGEDHGQPDGVFHFAKADIYITKNDPSGWYTGYVPIGDNPGFGHVFTLEEESVSELKGLELSTVEFEYYRFINGALDPQGKTIYTEEQIKAGTPLIQSGISVTKDQKVAEIKVSNHYREKVLKVNYQAVGMGTIDVQNQGTSQPKTYDTETFLYYSGISNGVKTEATSPYVFSGWYLDPECTEPVSENHGYVDEEGGFVPNKNKIREMIDADPTLEETGVTFYAKFEKGSIQINRENAEPGQVFVYKIEGNDKTMYVTVVAGEDGKGNAVIENVQFNKNYTITQVNDWSWRYSDARQTKYHQLLEGGNHGAKITRTIFTFDNPEVELNWLDGDSPLVSNKHGGVG